MDVFENLGLRRVINVSGTETPYGAAPVRPEVMAAVSELVGHSVFMSDLQEAAARTISRTLGSESGCVTGCTAASIAMAVAGCMAGTDPGRVEQLPDTAGMRDEVVVQKGHVVDYGQDVTQNIRLAGAKTVEIGVATACEPYQLRHALGSRTAAALYVVSHLTVQHRMIALDTFLAACHEHGVPAIVDAASMPDPRPYVKAGADLVLVSAHKSFAALTAGIVAGRSEAVAACLAQEHGIGRPMKVGKEGVIGAIAALEAWASDAHEEIRLRTAARVERAAARWSRLVGVKAAPHGRAQVRVEIDSRTAGLDAAGLSASLRTQAPAILAWDHHREAGVLLFTLGKVTDAQADYVISQVEEVMRRAAACA